MTAMPLVLSDDELRIILEAATPIRPQDRDQFLRDVADQLAHYREIRLGVVGRVCKELQRRHQRRAKLGYWPVSTLVV